METRPLKKYGLGFKIIAQLDDHLVVGHRGSVAGYRADLRFELKEHISREEWEEIFSDS